LNRHLPTNTSSIFHLSPPYVNVSLKSYYSSLLAYWVDIMGPTKLLSTS